MGLMAPWSYSSFFLDYDQDQVCGRIIHISDILNFLFFYRWTRLKGGNIARSPLLGFTDGLHIRITKKSS